MSDGKKGAIHGLVLLACFIVTGFFIPFALVTMAYLLYLLCWMIGLQIKIVRANRARRREMEAMLAAMPEAEREAYILKRMRAANTRRHFYWQGGWMYDRDL